MRAASLRTRLEPFLATESSAFDLAALLTFVMLLFYARDPSFPFMIFGPVSVAVLLAGLVWPRLRRSRLLWLYVSAALVWARLPQLLVMDNHHFLIAYWSIAVTTCLWVDRERPDALVARNARWLIGLAMAFAVLAKLRSGEFVNGALFEFLLLAGARFEAFSELVLRVPAADLLANQAAVARLLTPGARAEVVTEVVLTGPARVGLVAVVLSGWTLLIEGACAAAFLWPGRARWLRAVRNGSLLVFAYTTYAIATVGAFAWILIILGIAQCEREDRLARFAYSVAFLTVLLYAMPWGEILRAALP